MSCIFDQFCLSKIWLCMELPSPDFFMLEANFGFCSRMSEILKKVPNGANNNYRHKDVSIK